MPLYGPTIEGPIVPAELLSRGLSTKPDADALVSATERWTWRALDAATRRLAGNMLDLGLKPGDRVASLMPNRCALVIHYIACLRAGFVLTPLNYRYTPPEIDYALEVSEASALLAHEERNDDLARSKRVTDLPLGVFRYHEDGRLDDRSFAAMTARTPIREPAAPDLDAPALIFFTSGSTGRPKGVTHTHRTLGWQMSVQVHILQLAEDDVMLPAQSLSHCGASVLSFATLAVGGRAVEARTIEPDHLLALMRAEQPTCLYMLTTGLFDLVRSPAAGKADFASLRFCGAAGDKAAKELHDEFHALTGFPIAEGYGMTECGAATMMPISDVEKPGSAGIAVGGFAYSIRDGSGHEVAPGQDGVLWVKSPTVTVGYWNNPEATSDAIQDGWFNTGDVMTVDADGYFWFRGRKKQIIVHDDSNISPQEVEDSLLAHDAVAAAGVVGVHDLVHGENVWAFVAFKDGVEPPSSDDLIRFSKARVGYKAPEVIVVLDKIPLNATGKVDRASLKEMAAARAEATVRTSE
ncbi:MAG: acyl--CoA ligase [Alphaproteobacteria bacterium]|nr:acyl--CoA ligase [Alphaproteobacteria bacterium]